MNDPPDTAVQRTILVVEDEILGRLAVANYLRAGGYEVVEAGSVSEAQAILRVEKRIALIFSDIEMQDRESGFDLAVWTRAHLPHAKMILTSGAAIAAETARKLVPEAVFVPKPYNHAAIAWHIGSLLDGVAG